MYPGADESTRKKHKRDRVDAALAQMMRQNAAKVGLCAYCKQAGECLKPSNGLGWGTQTTEGKTFQKAPSTMAAMTTSMPCKVGAEHPTSLNSADLKLWVRQADLGCCDAQVSAPAQLNSRWGCLPSRFVSANDCH